MSSNNTNLADFVPSSMVLSIGTAISAVLYVVLIVISYDVIAAVWEWLSGAPVEPPKVGFMSDYSEPARNGYWSLVSASINLSIALSAVLPSLIGASIGHRLLGIVYLRMDGKKPKIGDTLKKTFCGIILFLMLTVPGPIIGFTLGGGSEWISLIALAIGFLATMHFAFSRDYTGRTWPFRFANLIPVYSSNKELVLEKLMR